MKHTKAKLLRAGLVLGLVILALAAAGIMAGAAPLTDLPVSLTQPDGTTLHCLASGDERFNYLHDADGRLIMLNPADGYYVYATTDAKGKLTATNLKALSNGYYRDPATNWMADGSDSLLNPNWGTGIFSAGPNSSLPPGSALPAFASSAVVTREDIDLTVNSHLVRDRDMPPRPQLVPDPPKYAEPERNNIGMVKTGAPLTGVMENIFILIAFADQSNEINAVMQNQIEAALNGPNAHSLKNYIKTVSGGVLEVSSTLLGINNGTVLMYQDAHPRSYYCPQTDVNPGGYTDANETQREHTLLKNAVQAVASSGLLAGKNLDVNNDGYVDSIMFTTMGGQGAWADLLWPHQWYLFSSTETLNGKRVWGYSFYQWDYIFRSLTNTNLGVLAHETLHVFDYPDLYRYDYSGDPVAQWDVMASTNSTNPQIPGIHTTRRYAGWGNEVPEITQNGRYTLSPIGNSTGTTAFGIAVPGAAKQFVMLEYRSNLNDSGLDTMYSSTVSSYRSGLTISRINTDYYGNADSVSGSRDEVFVYRPGETTMRAGNGSIGFAALSTAASRLSFGNDTSVYPPWDAGTIYRYDGANTNFVISNVSAAGSTISFDVKIKPEVARTLAYLAGSNGTLTAAYSGGGSVASGTQVPAGSNVNFTATPASSNYIVDKWYLDGVAQSTTGNAFSLANIQASRTVTVTFKPDPNKVVPEPVITTNPVVVKYLPNSASVQVTILVPSGAQVRYTTNGSTPTASSTPYSGPFNVTAGTTNAVSKRIVAYATRGSEIASKLVYVDIHFNAAGVTPAIKATGTGLTNLQVGTAIPANSAYITYTLANGVFADPLPNTASFNSAINNLPAGLTAGAVTRVNGSAVTVAITGTPTAAAAVYNLNLPANIAMANIANATANTPVTGPVAIGPVVGTVATPAITATATGLTGLKVGVPIVTGNAYITYTLNTGNSYAAAITNANFTSAINNLPAGLSIGAVTRANTTVTVNITGTPTAASTAALTLNRPSTIPAANVTGASAAVNVTGTLTVGIIAKGDGAATTGGLTANGVTATSITVSAASNSTANGQSVEYAISTSSSTTQTLTWQPGATFSSLNPNTTYYVFARTAENTNYNAGAIRVSAGITTSTAPVTPITLTQSSPNATANVLAGAAGRVPLTVTAPTTGEFIVTLQGTAGNSNAEDPALFNSANTRIAYQNYQNYNFTYDITLQAGQSWTGYAGTGGDVARSYTVTSIWTPAALTVSPTSWNPTSSASNQAVTVTSNTTWTVTSNQTWLTVTNIAPTNRTGNGSFTMNVTANTGVARTGTITIAGGGITRTITVTQAAPVATPAIAVSATGLTNLKVGVYASGTVTYTLTNGTYAASITAANFLPIGNIPAGMAAGTPSRNSNTTVIVYVTGTPTAANASTVNLTFPSSIPMANVQGATANIPVTGTVAAGPIAKGDGAATTGGLTANGVTATSITVNAAANNSGNGQTVEYAISTSSSTTQTLTWQDSPTFNSRTPSTAYYVFARTKENANYNAGTIRASAAITTLAAPAITVTAAGLTGLKVGVPIVTGNAYVRYTLNTGNNFAPAVTDAHFTSGINNLPAGLSIGAVTRANTTVTVNIVGTPTAANTSSITLNRPSTIPMANVTGATAAVNVTGTLTLGAIAKGSGAATSGGLAVSNTAATSLTFTAATNSSGNGQTVEYAVSTYYTSSPAGWQTSQTFTGLIPNTGYYVFARTASNANYESGPIRFDGVFYTSTTAVPVITATVVGLDNLKVGQNVYMYGAYVLFTLSGGSFSYTYPINASSFTVGNLPPGLTASPAQYESGTQVAVYITGIPTTANAGTRTLSLPGSIPAANVTGAGSAVMVSGTVSAGAVAKGNGAAVSGSPSESSTASNNITVYSVWNTGSTGQMVEYAISTSTGTPSAGWQSGTTFYGLSPNVYYYVFARTAENANYLAGTASRSAAIYTPFSYSSECSIIGVYEPNDAWINGTNLSANVRYYTDYVSFNLRVSDGASWALYSDYYCNYQLYGNTMYLNYGDNYAYVKVTAQDGTHRTYTVNVHREYDWGGDDGGGRRKIFSTRYDATLINWLLFFLCFGWIWMWF